MAAINTEDLIEALKRELEELEVLKVEAEQKYLEAEILDSEVKINAVTSHLYLRALSLPADESKAVVELIDDLISLFQKAYEMISRDSECKQKIGYRLTELQKRKEAVNS
jgi:hypothetical protein